LLTITATEKKDSEIRQQITAAPNTPTFLSNSVKVINFLLCAALSQCHAFLSLQIRSQSLDRSFGLR
jgi:hypothetical protein